MPVPVPMSLPLSSSYLLSLFSPSHSSSSYPEEKNDDKEGGFRDKGEERADSGRRMEAMTTDEATVTDEAGEAREEKAALSLLLWYEELRQLYI